MCEIRNTLMSKSMTAELRDALPRHMPVERFQRIALTCVKKTPKLMDNDRNSLWAAIMTAAQAGLYLDGFLGEAHLVPGKVNVTFQPGYKGLIKLARNSGEVCHITASIVYENDKYERTQGSEEKIIHESDDFGDKGEAIGVYAIATLRGGFKQFTTLDLDAIAEIQKSSYGSTKDNSPWVKFKHEMWKKSAVKRLCKLLPSSTDDLDRVVAVSNYNDTGRTANLNGDSVEMEQEVDEQTGESDRLNSIVEEEGEAVPL